MNKKQNLLGALLCGICLLLGSLPASAQTSQSPTPAPERRKIKTQRIESARYTLQPDGSYLEGARHLSNLLNYNERGQRVDDQHFDARGSLTQRETWKYDERNRLVEFTEFDGAGKQKRRHVSVYDEQYNSEIESKIYDADDRLIEHKKYRYQYEGDERLPSTRETLNSKGELVERSVSVVESQTNRRVTYIYDADGKLTGTFTADLNRPQNSHQIEEYDSSGKVSKRATEKVGNDLITTFEHGASKTKILLKTETDADGRVLKTVSSYLDVANDKTVPEYVQYYSYTYY
ncbi:MAG: hypothetical protein MSG64_05710 [Pyrinomonadaceae bacterium MAG19_C2-C3]|nr:hypothetical protein [Pyrinomonadaceae bacterium MAG19_C2-C3]